MNGIISKELSMAIHSKRILVVDDNEFDRKLLIKALSKKGGFTLVEVESGEKCLELIAHEKVDLILMDIMMPNVFGTQILKTIREKSNAIELPVIMITAKTDASDVVESLNLGANDYISKPINFDIAISRINTHLSLADISKKMGHLQQMAALHAMISTYNHEINNPLTIAICGIKKMEAICSDKVNFKKIEAALWRVAEIVKKIRETSQKQEIQYEPYAGSGKMIKIK